MMLPDKSVGFIGLGNMGFAIYKGFTGSPASQSATVYCYDKYKAFDDITPAELVAKCKYILLCVKPQTVDEVLAEIAPAMTDDNVIISICAGISAEYIRARTFEKAKVVRVMPNMPMMLGEGASAISTDDITAPAELDYAVKIIAASCPVVEVVAPDKMNEIIAVNGSSPAFIYLFAKCFSDYAKEQGIDERAARNLISQTIIGAGKMLVESNESIDDLIAQVTSKGGTTIAGLEQLYKTGLVESVKAACAATTARAYELGKNN